MAAAHENGEKTIGLFWDFSKAFDTVNYDILFKKLEHYGLRGTILNWFQNYLSNRSQNVNYKMEFSQEQELICGVPQGSVLGPLLFLLYVNDLALVSNKLTPIMFADDSSFFIHGKKTDEMADIINQELEEIVSWLNANRLSLNIRKTKSILFNPTKDKKTINISLKILDEKIEQVEEIKFLGVILDENLTWKKHIQYINRKIAKNIGIISKARTILNKKTLLTLYYTFIYPYLNYCITSWGSANKTILDPLIKLQKKAVRLISNAPKLTHTKPLFFNTRVLTVNNLYIYNIGSFMHAFINGKQPIPFNNMFTFNSYIHNHGTRQASRLHTPVGKTSFSYKTIKFRGVSIYNNIIFLNIDTKCSTAAFKAQLKDLLLSGHNFVFS